MKIPNKVEHIIQELEKNSFEGFIVGGCVRDYVLGTTPKDFDITTDALPDDIKNIFAHTVDTGIEYGTVSVIINKECFELTTYRIDGEYKNSRSPENVTFTKNITEDLSRRDFTMNAIAYNKKDGFIDPFGGINDIKHKLIKGVGEPDLRFKEDALRMMRCVRFSVQLGFDIDDKTMHAITQNAKLLQNISIERIQDEFIKMICSKYIERIYLLEQTTLYHYFIEEISPIFIHLSKNIHILKVLDSELRLSFLLHHLGELNAEKVLKRLKLSNKVINETKYIIKYINYQFIEDRVEIKKIMSKICPDIIKKALNIKFAISLVQNNLVECKKWDNVYDEVDDAIRKDHCYKIKDLAINGTQIKDIGITNGKQIGEILALCLDIVIEDNTKNTNKYLTCLVNKYKLDNIEGC